MAPRASRWSTELRIAIGRTLSAAGRPLRASDVAKALDKDRSHITATLKRLVAEEMVVEHPPAEVPDGRGPRPKTYELSPPGQLSLAEIAPPVVGTLSEGDHVVLADADTDSLPELLEIFATAEGAAQSAWSFLATGQGDRYAIVFQGTEAARRASDLLSVLAAVQIPSSRVVLSDFESGLERVAESQRRTRAGRRARVARDTRAA